MSKFNVYLDVIIRRKYSQKQNDDLYELYDGKLIDLSNFENGTICTTKKEKSEREIKIKNNENHIDYEHLRA